MKTLRTIVGGAYRPGLGAPDTHQAFHDLLWNLERARFWERYGDADRAAVYLAKAKGLRMGMLWMVHTIDREDWCWFDRTQGLIEKIGERLPDDMTL